MAAIPNAGGARCVPRGMLRALPWAALLRVAVLGGLVVAGWLLGSGIGQAQEELTSQDLGQQNNTVELVGFSLPDDDSEGPLGAAPASGMAATGSPSTLSRGRPCASLPRQRPDLQPGEKSGLPSPGQSLPHTTRCDR